MEGSVIGNCKVEIMWVVLKKGWARTVGSLQGEIIMRG